MTQIIEQRSQKPPTGLIVYYELAQKILANHVMTGVVSYLSHLWELYFVFRPMIAWFPSSRSGTLSRLAEIEV